VSFRKPRRKTNHEPRTRNGVPPHRAGCRRTGQPPCWA
jgi:hypothetical protein